MFKCLDAEGRDAPIGRIKNKDYNNRRERSECPPVPNCYRIVLIC